MGGGGWNISDLHTVAIFKSVGHVAYQTLQYMYYTEGVGVLAHACHYYSDKP